MFNEIAIDELTAFTIGHHQDKQAVTGCSVIICRAGLSGVFT